MRLYGLRVIVKKISSFSTGLSPFTGKIGQVMAYKFDTQRGVCLLVRFGDEMVTFNHDEVSIHPDDVQEWEEEQQKLREMMHKP